MHDLQSAYDVGISLRKLYIERLGYLPDIVSQDGSTYFRSTLSPRTMETLHQIIQGLYPSSKRSGGFVPRLLSRNADDENLVANTLNCPRLKQLETHFRTVVIKTENSKLSQLDTRISKYFDGKSIALDAQPRAYGIFDTIKAAEAHGLAVPEDFQDPMVQRVIETACCNQNFAGYQASKEFRTLGMGPLLDDLRSKLQNKRLKIAVMITHDTALAGLLSTLDVFDNRWPDFTASITFELFSKKSASNRLLQSSYGKQGSEYYVRMRYRNKSLKIPACASAESHLEGHPEFCTFQAFKDLLRRYKPENREDDCKKLRDITIST